MLINLLKNINLTGIGDSSFDEFGNLVANLGYGGQKIVLGGRFDTNDTNEFFVGDVHIQLGYVVTEAVTFNVTFPTAFNPEGKVYVFIQENGDNDNVARVEFQTVTTTGFTVTVQQSTVAEAYFWIAIGKRM